MNNPCEKETRKSHWIDTQEYVEPAAADIIECPGSEVHGMAILLDKEAEARMDQHEVVGFGYRKKYLEFQAYDGRKLEGGE